MQPQVSSLSSQIMTHIDAIVDAMGQQVRIRQRLHGGDGLKTSYVLMRRLSMSRFTTRGMTSSRSEKSEIKARRALCSSSGCVLGR